MDLTAGSYDGWTSKFKFKPNGERLGFIPSSMWCRFSMSDHHRYTNPPMEPMIIAPKGSTTLQPDVIDTLSPGSRRKEGKERKG
jgi:hypothetical protein